MSALQDAQGAFTGVEEAHPDCVEENAQAIQEFNAIRSLPLYYPYIGSGFGRGVLVELLDGSCKYDLICGIGVHYFGHSFAGIIESSLTAALSDTVMQGNLQQDVDSFDLARRFVELSGLDHCFLSSSGAMACENALKICFQKKQPATRVLAFERCFAGRTLALSQLTDKPGFREGLPPTITVDYVPFFDKGGGQRECGLFDAESSRISKRFLIYRHSGSVETEWHPIFLHAPVVARNMVYMRMGVQYIFYQEIVLVDIFL